MTDPSGDPSALDDVAAFGVAWAEHDLTAVLALISDDCVFDDTSPAPDGTRVVGRVEIGEAWRPLFDDPATRFEEEETIAVDDRVVQRWRYSWADGHVRGVDVFRVRAGLVVEKLSYVKG